MLFPFACRRQGISEIVQVDGFAEVGVHAGGEEFFLVSSHGEGGQGDDGDFCFCAGP